MLVDIWRNKKSMSVQKTIFFFFIEKSGHGVIGLLNSTDIKERKKNQFFIFISNIEFLL